MKNRVKMTLLFILPAIGLLFCGPAASAQDTAKTVHQMKQDIARLKKEVNDLKKAVQEIKKSLEERAEALPPAGQKGPAAGTGLSDPKQIKSIVCKSIDKYIADVDASLRLKDESAVQSRMNKAFTELRAVLSKYSQNEDVAKLLSMADDMDWDTYTEVSLRDTAEGTASFKKSIEDQKRKMRSYCSGK